MGAHKISETSNFDCLIFGGGLAGSVLAWTLIQQGKRPLVIDLNGKSRCSQVAAGLINPIGGKRLNLVWDAEVQIPYAINFYRQLEARFEQPLFEKRPLVRLFSNREEASHWNEKRNDKRYSEWTQSLTKIELPQLDALENRSAFAINKGGVLDIPTSIMLVHEALNEKGLFEASEFKYQDIKVNEEAIRWKEFAAPFAVFTEGHLATENPWFSFVPYKPAKGVIGRISTDIQLPDTVIIEEKFLVPKSSHAAVVGATYRWDELNDVADSEGIHELEAFLRKFLGDRWKWTDVSAGVRPSIPGAKPSVGPHPEFSNLFSFNGFGSKGATQTPLLALALHDYIWNSSPLPDEILPARFYKTTNTLPKRWIAVEIARDQVLEHIGAGDTVVDATTGNGHDTLWLAQRVGPSGKVYAFDLQKTAIQSARNRIESAKASTQTHFINACHSTLARQLPEKNSLSAAVFNLGYLPNGDKTVVTKPETTIAALDQSLSLMKPGGILSIVVYPGHKGGDTESSRLLSWSQNLDRTQFQTEVVSNPSGNPNSPFLLFVERIL